METTDGGRSGSVGSQMCILKSISTKSYVHKWGVILTSLVMASHGQSILPGLLH